MDRYPGDDCVDIVAFDYYDDYNTYPAEYSGEFVDNLKKTCQVVKNIADAKEPLRYAMELSNAEHLWCNRGCNFRNRCKGDEGRWIG